MHRYPKATIAGGIFLGVIAAGVVFLLLFDFKSFTERRATEALGRPVTIGALDIDIFPLEVLLTDLNVADVAVGQPIPANKPLFMRAAHVDAALGFWRLLVGDVLFKRLVVEDAVARIERRPDGALSWEVERPNDKARIAKDAKVPEIRDLHLRDVKLLYRDDSAKTRLTLSLNTRDNPKGGEPSLLLKGNGTYAGAPSTITATGGSILALRDSAQPYPIDGNLTSGPTSITVKGTVTDPTKITGLNINLQVKGSDAADLYRVAGIALPPTPPYTIDTHVDRDGARWIFKALKWNMGKSDFAGAVVWDLSDKKPLLSGKLHANVVSFPDLGGFIGAAPGEAETPTEVRRAAAERERDRRVAMSVDDNEKAVAAELVIPDKQIDFRKLNSMNAKVQLGADKIIDANFPLDSFKTDVVLQDGLLTLKPLIFTAGNGSIAINLAINGREQPMRMDAVAEVKAFPLQRLIGTAKENNSWGAIGGRITLKGHGNSLHAILANSDGDVGLAVGGGELSLFLVELMGVDLAEALGIILTKDRPTPIRCIVADFGIEKGKMTARTAVADTRDTVFNGTGSIDLGREIMDMRIHAKPKDVSPVTLRSKLLVQGTFANPALGPDTGNMILRGGAAAALGVVLTPFASLLALIDVGGGKDANCTALFKELEK
jgi:uncharacterized protein involved in outer membrane biogenesis